MKNTSKKYLVLITEESTNGTIYSERFNSLFLASLKAERFRAIYGSDTVSVIDTRSGEVLAGF